MDYTQFRYIVVGSGFFGSTVAERIANDLGQPVLVLEARPHLGGNSYSYADPVTGIEHHLYGSHIFHTRDLEVWNYVNRFAAFNHYRHRVLTRWRGETYFMPINLDTINRFYRRCMTPDEAGRFLAAEAAKAGISTPGNFEEKAISQIGKPLYEAFIRGYTSKQWGVAPASLSESILSRLPVRTSYHCDYFDDPYQGIPTSGYGAMFGVMLDHPLIAVRLNTNYFHVREALTPSATVIFSGAIDRFFDFRFGSLAWRSLRFETEVKAVDDFQGNAVVNYAEEDVPFTRIHEFKHYHPERRHLEGQTLICREYPAPFFRDGEPFYPVGTADDQRLLSRYQELVSGLSGRVLFGGRLGAYRYYNMDQVIRQALDLYHQAIKIEPFHG